MVRGVVAFLVFLTAVAAVAAAQEVYPGPPPGTAFRAPGRGLVPPAVLPADRIALEEVLTSALEGSGPDQPMARTMPSTSSLEIVASASFARRTGEPCIGCRNPCRNFRYTYVRPDRGSVSVEGARCRRPNGRWAPLTPDMVVAESPARAGLARRVPPQAVPMPPETMPGPMPGTGGLAAVMPPAQRSPAAPPIAEALPLPRPSWPDDVAALGAEPPAPDGEAARLPDAPSPAVDAARSALSEEAAEPADASPETLDEPPPPELAPAPAEPAQAATEPAPEETPAASVPPEEGAPADATAAPGSDRVAAATPSGAAAAPRVVMPFGGSTAPPVTVETVADPELVRLLRQLSYLDPRTSDEPSKAALDAAVAEFAADEGIALPAPTEEIKRRLEAAIDRTADLGSCGEAAAGSGYGVCLEKQP